MNAPKGSINLMLNWGNFPQVEVLFDKIPPYDPSTLRFEERNGVYRAEEADGTVHFFHWIGPHNEGGFGSRQFPVIMVDGEERVLKGPWSSNADSVNMVFSDREPCVEITFMEESNWINAHGEKHYSRIAGAMTIKRLCEIFELPRMTYVEFMCWMLQQKIDAMPGKKTGMETYIHNLQSSGSMWKD